jgi:hypothetical protein
MKIGVLEAVNFMAKSDIYQMMMLLKESIKSER